MPLKVTRQSRKLERIRFQWAVATSQILLGIEYPEAIRFPGRLDRSANPDQCLPICSSREGKPSIG